MIHRVEGLVVRGYRMSESSKVVVLYTHENGKVRLVAKGARRPKSRFGASLEPITLGHYVYYSRENRDLQTLSEGDIRHPFFGIKRAYKRVVFASVVCEFLDHMTADEDRNPLLYSATLDSLRWMEVIPEESLELPLWYFQLKAAAALGYRPHLSGCVQCGIKITGSRVRFSPALGGTVCDRCTGSGMTLKYKTIQLLEQLQVGRPDRIKIPQFEGVDWVEGRNALRRFLVHHIERSRRLRALEFLDRMLAVGNALPVAGQASLAAECADLSYPAEAAPKRR